MYEEHEDGSFTLHLCEWDGNGPDAMSGRNGFPGFLPSPFVSEKRLGQILVVVATPEV